MEQYDFSSIEPYTGAEVPAAIRRLSQNALFRRWVKTINPKVDINSFAAMMECVNTCEELQFMMMRPLVYQIMKGTSTSFAYDGLEHVKPGVPYLFVSNHRDIVLDASLLDVALLSNGIQTPEIGFGNNLLKNDFMTDIFRLNKMFTIIRDGSRREFYNNSMFLSHYIRHVLFEKRSSVWIAQRNGRTKDGNDRTDQGLLKMFSMASGDDFEQYFNALHILPVAISYEYEPCDDMKAYETYISMNGIYTKSHNEDLLSIMSGIMSQKGHVHISFCEPLTTDEVADCGRHVKNDRFTAMTEVIDRRIHLAYKLHSTNYIAADLLAGTAEWEEHYSTEQMERFIDHIEECSRRMPSEPARERFRDVFMSIYANPLLNWQAAQNAVRQ